MSAKIIAFHPTHDRAYDLSGLFRGLQNLYGKDFSELAQDLEETQELLHELHGKVDEEDLSHKIILVRELKYGFRKMKHIQLSNTLVKA